MLLVTASQLNRSAVEEIEFDHSHISGGISKINTADNLFGIFTSRAMREHGRYQLQLMKTRSSGGVGQKVELEFDVDSLRIRDAAEEGDTAKKPMGIMSQLRSNPPLKPAETAAAPMRAEVNSSKLKQMLANIKSTS
jgi:hypothetical protein